MKNKKAFLCLILGQAVANIGDTIYTVAVISAVYSWTNSAFASAIVPVIFTGAMMVAGFLTPLLSMKLSLDKMLKLSQLMKTIFLFILAGYLSYLSEQIELGVIYLLIACIAFLDGCAEPVSMALIPQYVEKEALIRANSLFSTMLQVVNIGSWAVGASLLVWFSVSELVWIDVGLFLLCSGLFLLLPRTVQKATQGSKWKELKKGWQYVWKEPLIRTVVVMDTLEGIANTAWVSSLVLVFVSEVLKQSDKWWGYINAFYFVGALLGSVIVMKNPEWFDRSKGKAIVAGSFFGGIATLLVLSTEYAPFILMCTFLIGIFFQVKNIPQATVIQQRAKEEKLLAVYAASGMIYMGTFSIAMLFMGRVADVFGVKLVYLFSGILLLLVSAIGQKKKNLFT
ncbi:MULTISPECIES: MFS transporter [unclassified Enterococcus]|uniref:MFS transporter n=1 Tax=unclassified Enterococcus TaxID=2608891 RepID=UPI001A9AD88F|nr:MFS transporter [Enterococcus sp. DIV1271a]MBO1298803.1 MFS transporter [Enterococcus sp. DIV1271a]